MMSNQDRKNAMESAATEPLPLETEIDDLPPPYTPHKISAEQKPPPLPSIPPALTQQPLPATRPRISRSPNPRTSNYGSYQFWEESCKGVCCLALCWSWSKCVCCIEGCVEMCPEPKAK